MQRLWRFMCVVMAVWFVSLSSSVLVVRAQNGTRATRPTTDPTEARVLNAIFTAWNVRATREWNISGEVCSGIAVDDSVTIDDRAYNPLIKCDCSFVNSTICRITALKVYAMEHVLGPIPDQLWTLVYLTNLNLAQNFLTGPLSPAIGNLTRMQWLTFGINGLTGPVPKEIGLLTDLRSLSLSSNNFSGSLPAEIGNCRRLQKIYIGSSGLSGEIPTSFANLVELEEAWITDMELTGPVPDFIGNWTKLIVLRIFGTGLSGPIPSSFANLTSLTELRLGEISNSSSSLEFIRDMKSLSVLVLRNNDLTGMIPPTVGEYLNLQQLDLSFNNLTGPIPSSVFNLSSLTHLFLGNNRLTGSLPNQKSQSLSNIDVSYNDLSGILPSWISLQNLQLNLVANNFTLDESSNRFLPGLNCLQKSFPCNRGKGIYFNFSINCGGPQIRSASEALYEKEDEALGPSSFVVSNTQRWAASNIGRFTGSNSNLYVASSQAQFVNTLDSELFQTARLSPSSLRYYGLGLENGGYTITLQFAEIQMQSPNTWRGLGRRLFDIYVQGRLVEKDFDIRRTANGSIIRAVQRSYKSNVSENYLEIHLFWAGKGTCCIPLQGTYGPLVSAISASPDFIPTVNNRPLSEDKNRTGTIVGVVVGLGVAIILVIALIFIIRRRRKRYTDDEELLGMDIKPYTFSYSELRSATQDFDPSNKLGEGGFGAVYKGKLDDGSEIAVKQLSVASRQGKGQFIAEIATTSEVQHRNLVKLYGCCFEGDHRLLVYEYLPNKSLDQALFGEKTLHLDWSTRFEICLGIARGLAYLHEESRLRIVHRDVKASNILLDSNLVPKISDFGLAKLYDDKKTHMSTRVAGTIGYLAPEYAMRGHLTEKTDVFAFGVVALEVVSGRPNSDQDLVDDRKYLLEWAWNLHEKNREVELVDPDLVEFNEEEVKRVIAVALLCTQTSHTQRPQMSRVMAMLSGDVEVTAVASKPGYLTEWRFEDITSFVSGEEAAAAKTTGSTETYPDSSFSTSLVTPDSEISPSTTVTKPMLGIKIKEGR
ncbi:PREDICTED: probable LRR receptor-like serine/threonine-protein kinase At1g56140 isoform X2 [Tarenaya hassleriana]|uniref:probable LRR receptor-like serine/threonine-protein kinase At1g56140 isoform X2 n=1 Tax=Tarenaya hassleriana TaxID=28532 RepID=UPI00053C923D|nr:PREDICTED: probable LRR receptor-like serine/threonine-protein kinase At1g56140 isoform X2 [Tarenaya hassleriana]